MKENSKDNDCSCVGQGASEQGGITTALPGHSSRRQTRTRFLPTRRRQKLQQRMSANGMVAGTHKEPGEHFAQHLCIDSLRSLAMLNSFPPGQVSLAFGADPGHATEEGTFLS